MEAGLCKCVAIFRAMNGFSQVRIGGTGARSAAPVSGDMLHNRAYGWQSAGQSFAPTFMRHMYDYGTTPEQVAHVKMFHSRHASNNPKAYYKKRFTVDDVISSRFICKPLHLLDCCVETDNGTCVIVTRADRAKDMKQPLVLIRGAARAEGSGTDASGPPAELPAAVRHVLASAGLTSVPPAARGAVRERWESLAAIAGLADDLASARPTATLSRAKSPTSTTCTTSASPSPPAP